MIGVPKGTPNAAITEELGVTPVEYKIESRKLMEYHRVLRMGEERLPKQSIINAKEIGCKNLLDDAHTIMMKHSITCGDSEVMNMTPKQWKRMIEKKMSDTINRETLENCAKKTKLHEIADGASLKNYWKCLTWENARTVFEVRTNMLRMNCNYGQKDETCQICGERETTKHVFECTASQDHKLTMEKYRALTRTGGPQGNMQATKETAEAIRSVMKERSKIKQIIEKFG